MILELALCWDLISPQWRHRSVFACRSFIVLLCPGLSWTCFITWLANRFLGFHAARRFPVMWTHAPHSCCNNTKLCSLFFGRPDAMTSSTNPLRGVTHSCMFLAFLVVFRVQGACLCHIRPEYLLDVQEFKHWCSLLVNTHRLVTLQELNIKSLIQSRYVSF